jgi:hypothetical protein
MRRQSLNKNPEWNKMVREHHLKGVDIIDLSKTSMSLNELAASIKFKISMQSKDKVMVNCLPNEKKMKAVLKIIERTHCFMEYKEVTGGYEFYWNPDKKVEGWLPMESAPKNATWVMVKMKDGSEIKAHWAEDLSGDFQPPFKGWFKKNTETTNIQIDEPVKWKPIKKSK